MILTIDIGNTNIKLGLFDAEGKLIKFFKTVSDTSRTADEYTGLILQMTANAEIDRREVTGAIISSVIPKLDVIFTSAVYYIFGVRPLIVNAKLETGLKIDYISPETLGSDRLAACVAAKRKYGVPFILVDYGTATTYNVVNERDEFLGGAITLGMKSAADALARCAAKLEPVELAAPQTVVSRSTDDAVCGGIVFGAVGQTKYLLDRIMAETGLFNAKLIATGGLSHLIQSVEPIFDYIDRDLALEGLYELYNVNNGSGIA